MAAAQGFAALLGIGATSTVDKPLEFLSESLALDEELVDSNGIRGTRSHISEVVRQGIRRVGGNITLCPHPTELAALLPYILGANASGTTFALAETLQSFYASVDRVLKVFTYSGCVVSKAVFSGSAGQPLNLSLEIVGIDESVGNAGSFPSLTLDTTTTMYMFHDLVLIVGGTTYQCFDFELTIDNMVDAERFLNSQTRVSIPAQDRVVTLNTNLPYGDASAAYALSVGGVAVTATFTNGATSLLFTLPKVQFPRKSPTVPGKSEIKLPLMGVARKSGSTKELEITLDSTP